MIRSYTKIETKQKCVGGGVDEEVITIKEHSSFHAKFESSFFFIFFSVVLGYTHWKHTCHMCFVILLNVENNSSVLNSF